ncbi:MAG: hypothetical protein QOH39_1094 [Verrucomicrobiota bacterium]|jgi:hypothetical protein
MVAFTEYAFSWYTLVAIGVYFAFAVAVYRRIRDHHPELHERFGGHRVWFSMPDQLRFFGFLFGFRYLQEHDTTLSILASLMYLLGVIATFFILTQPIY